MSEQLPSGLSLPKIGFGMWKIGGGMSADPTQDARSLAALDAALDCGYTHFDTAEMYANGHSEVLLAEALQRRRFPREQVLITTKVHPSNLHFQNLIDACENSLRRLRTDYIDLYLIHWPGRAPLEETFEALNQLQESGKIRHIGVSNFDLETLARARELCASPIVTNQVAFSIASRSCEKNGILAYCQANDIVLTAYSPVEEGRLRVREALVSVAEKHGATPYQIALAWLIRQPRVIAIPMSMDPVHIRENFEAQRIELDEADLTLLG